MKNVLLGLLQLCDFARHLLPAEGELGGELVQALPHRGETERHCLELLHLGRFRRSAGCHGGWFDRFGKRRSAAVPCGASPECASALETSGDPIRAVVSSEPGSIVEDHSSSLPSPDPIRSAVAPWSCQWWSYD